MNREPPETEPSEIAKEYDHVLLSHDRLDEFMDSLSKEEMKQLTIFTEDEHTKGRSKYLVNRRFTMYANLRFA